MFGEHLNLLPSSSLFLNSESNFSKLLGLQHIGGPETTRIHPSHCQGLRATLEKLAKSLQIIMLRNDVSRNEGNYTLIKQ